MSSLSPDYEELRLDALVQLKLLDTPPSESFDRITRMASLIFGLPVAAVSLTDRDRQWFKSRVGVDHCSIPRDGAPCARVAEAGQPLVIEDLLEHPHYAGSVLAQAGTRFYAGAPLITSEGYGLGALCVLGTEPRRAAPAELAALVDLAAMVMAQIELQHAFGRIDPVSGLPMRGQFRDDLLDLAREHHGERQIVVLVDIARDEQISRISRALGGGRVEDLIREAARSLRAALDGDRRLYHVGAAQFAFLAPPGSNPDDYTADLRAAFAALRASSSVRFVTSLAIGVRPFVLGEVSPDDLLRGAAAAAQDARGVSGSISLYSSSSDRAHQRQYVLMQDFGAALAASDQLRLVYQPRINLATGRCIGAEALLRWRHPRLGDVSPSEFIPIIEQTSLAQPTTRWVLDAAMTQLARWQHGGLALRLSVNLSAVNLSETDLVVRVQGGLSRARLLPEQLELELTESAIMEHPEQAIGVLRELAAAGICLAIDDFGTGQSSLAYLQQIPAQIVKIDQAFVRSLTRADGADYVLLETMVAMAHKLGYRVVAEGVETSSAAEIVAGLGCEEAQGFWFARPMEADAFASWMRSHDGQRRGRGMSGVAGAPAPPS